MAARLLLDRDSILAFRRRAGALDERLPAGPDSLHLAAWAGLQDSVPRAALLSLHARVAGTGPSAWEDPSLVQLWGPRFSAYVVAAADLPVFSLGRLPEDGARRRRAEETADRLDAFLAGRRMPYGEAGRGLGHHGNMLRYAAPTGRVLIRWNGARQPEVWMVPPPTVSADEARRELARRFLHVFGPATPASFVQWAGIRPPRGRSPFDPLAAALVAVRTPIGDAWILAADEPAFREPPAAAAPARLLPSGDAYYLLQGADRALLVPDAARRGELWTPRVWPGAIVAGGEVAGTWRRAQEAVSLRAWRPLSARGGAPRRPSRSGPGARSRPPSARPWRRRRRRCRCPTSRAPSAWGGPTDRARSDRWDRWGAGGRRRHGGLAQEHGSESKIFDTMSAIPYTAHVEHL
jgi:hypothetical protein